VNDLPLADSYPLGGVIWTMLVFFAWVFWIIIAIRCFSDIFRRHDMSGFVKVIWCVFIIIAPFLGVFVYILAYHTGMAERDLASAQAAQQQMDQYIRSTAGGGSAAEIEKAKGLLDSGAITQAEFDQIKAKALAGSS
jgi:putative oligomerization/nucleic acid binding protein/phospholipase D-like protein